MNNWQSSFGGSVVKPSDVQYESLSLSANLALLWPTESMAGATYVADWVDVTATTTSLSIAMPDATTGATGVAGIFANIGSNSFTVRDAGGTQIAVIAASQAWIVLLVDNTTVNGVWRAYQLASTTSNAQASSLAGAGLKAFGSLLESDIETFTISTDSALTTAHRACAVNWTGDTAGTLQLDTIANLGVGWWAIVNNQGATTLSITTTNDQTINGLDALDLPESDSAVGYSTLIVCAAGGFTSYFFDPSPTSIEAGGTGADNATQALVNLGGTDLGIDIFTAPTAAAILALLGISTAFLTESTVATNQALTAGGTGTIYVATAALNVSLPQTGTVTTSFVFGVYAQNGIVTITPAPADAINGATPGVALSVPKGEALLMVTDAAGNWWPLFLPLAAAAGEWAVAGGTGDAITAAYVPANTALTDGMLLGFRASAANATTTPTFSPDGLTVHTVTKKGGVPLAPGDIPGALSEELVRYNLANTRWELLNPAGGSGGAGASWAVAAGTADAITATYSPPNSALSDGLLLGIRASGANTITAPTFAPDGLTLHTITKRGGGALIPGDIPGNLAEVLFRYNLANTRWELLNPSGSSAGSGAMPGAFRNLKIFNNAGTPNTKADISADSIVVGSSLSGPCYVLASVAVTCDIAVNGANGLDTGGVAASTWYSVWVIYNGSTAASLFSLSATAPTLPAGYSFFARVGWMRTGAGSTFLRTLQYGRTARYTAPALPVMASGAVGSITVPTWVAVATGNFVPSTASEIAVVAQATSTNSVVMAAPNNSYGAWTSTTNTPPLVIPSPGSTTTSAVSAQFLLESSNIYWASQGASNSIFCAGWSDNL